MYPQHVIETRSKTKYHGMTFSGGWFTAFKRQNNVVLQKSTKKAQQVPEPFRKKVINLFQFVQHNSQPLPDQASQFGGGRYRLCDITMDQTPIIYKFFDGTTYDFKGAKTIWVITHCSGWDKQLASLQLLVSADGINRCKVLFLFREKSVLSTRLKKKVSQYDPRVVVQ